MKKIVVIGAGLGGLSAACRLAKSGFCVTVVEKNGTPGGKVNYFESNGFHFDTGASLVTMKHVFEELFEFCGRSLDDYLIFERLDPICRYFWSDGTRFDASGDAEETERRIAVVEPRDAAGFRDFLADSRDKYEVAERTFLKHNLSDMSEMFTRSNLGDLWKISALRSLDSHVGRYFKSAKMRQLFDRFATYNGSSPYKVPATFSLIPYVEFGLGAWYPTGGIYGIPTAITKLAAEMGVEIKLNSEVEKIVVEDGKTKGVDLVNGETLEADFIVANSDAIDTYRNLVSSRDYPLKKLDRIEPSCSGFVLLLGTNVKFPQLAHHNIFFSDDYRAEFRSMFDELRPSKDPTIYVCATSRTDVTQAPEGCENLFILVNAPYTSERTDWSREGPQYRDLIISKLEQFGLEGLNRSVVVEESITPDDFRIRYRANRGSIYGVSSNGIFSAFLRPRNKSRDVEGLYFAGGTTHPGGGMPLVLISGRMAAELVLRDAAPS
ncbi:MAG: phytoene desaturase [Acidobacteria bacterium]|nr:phytoene desaturase [Acidobacteriota bacterium]